MKTYKIRRGWMLWSITSLLGARTIRTYKRLHGFDTGQARIYEEVK